MKFSMMFGIASLVGICSFNAYSSGRYFIQTGDTQLKTDTIRITGHHNDGTLDLKDSMGNDATTINVFYGDDVVWLCIDPDITILKIQEKPGTGNHFKHIPASQTSKKWKGTVNNYTDHKVHTSNYFIKWKASDGMRTYDPLIRINPSSPINGS